MKPSGIILVKPGSRLDRFLTKQLSSNQFSYQEIFAMYFPVLLDQFFIFVITVCSSALISSSSQESVTAVSLIAPVQGTLLCLANAFSAGGAVVVAQYRGKQDPEKTRQSGGQVILGSVFLAIVLASILCVFADTIVNTMYSSVSDVVKEKGTTYLIGMSLSMIWFSVYQSCFSVLRGIGESKLCLNLTVFINVIYLGLNIIFINVLKLDIVGTALAMNIARVFGAIVAVHTLMGKRSPLRVRASDIFRVQKNMLLSIMKVGLPFGMEQIFFNGGNLIVQMYMAGLGTAPVAAYSITNSSTGLMYAAAMAMGTLAVSICGRCYGAGDKELTRHYGKQMLRMATVLIILSIAIFYPLMPLIMKLYHAPAETMEIIRKLRIVLIISMPFFYSGANVMPNILRSAGDSSFSSTVSLVAMWAVRVGLGYLLGIVLDYGILGIMCCMGIEWAVKTLVYGLRFRGDKWLSKKTIQ